MTSINRTIRRRSAATLLALVATLATAKADKSHFYNQVNLVSDLPGQARFTDPYLLNPWGLSFVFGDLAVADNHAGVATFYRPSGHSEDLVLTIPSPAGPGTLAAPADMAFNEAALRESHGFDVMLNGESVPSLMLIVGEDGTISSWVPFFDSLQVVIAVDNSATGAIYKGVALAQTRHGKALFVSNFHQGFVEMYDQHFQLVKTFTDPTLPAGFAPFGIREIGGRLFVTFAKQKAPDNADDQAGPGLGYVDIFDTSGNLIRRCASPPRGR